MGDIALDDIDEVEDDVKSILADNEFIIHRQRLVSTRLVVLRLGISWLKHRLTKTVSPKLLIS